MLVHELTHVVKQRRGPVDGTPVDGGVKVSEPSDRFEREAAATAERVLTGPALALAPTSPAAAAAVQCIVDAAVQRDAGPALQRDGEDDDVVQGSFVQQTEDKEGTAS